MIQIRRSALVRHSPQRMFDLTEGLIRRKYTDAQIEGILGGNFRRVLSDVWRV